jgi:hypothetical protein
MPHALAPATPVPTLDERRSQEDGVPVTLGCTPDQMPGVIWPRGDDPVLEVGCVQIRLFRLPEGLRAAGRVPAEGPSACRGAAAARPDHKRSAAKLQQVSRPGAQHVRTGPAARPAACGRSSQANAPAGTILRGDAYTRRRDGHGRQRVWTPPSRSGAAARGRGRHRWSSPRAAWPLPNCSVTRWRTTSA